MTRMQQKIVEKGEPLFDVWMKQESDLIQLIGTTYGEHMCFDISYDMIKKNNLGNTNE